MEDTATFFAIEINEAYSILISQSKEKNISANQSKHSYQSNQYYQEKREEQKPAYDYYSQQKTSYSKQKSPIETIVKIIIAIIVFCIIYQQFNNPLSSGNRLSIFGTRTTSVYATVKFCDWLNVRSSPSSVNNSNIVEAISVNTKVEILDHASNGWVQIRYNNDKIGYIHSNYLSQ